MQQTKLCLYCGSSSSTSLRDSAIFYCTPACERTSYYEYNRGRIAPPSLSFKSNVTLPSRMLLRRFGGPLDDEAFQCILGAMCTVRPVRAPLTLDEAARERARMNEALLECRNLVRMTCTIEQKREKSTRRNRKATRKPLLKVHRNLNNDRAQPCPSLKDYSV